MESTFSLAVTVGIAVALTLGLTLCVHATSAYLVPAAVATVRNHAFAESGAPPGAYDGSKRDKLLAAAVAKAVSFTVLQVLLWVLHMLSQASLGSGGLPWHSLPFWLHQALFLVHYCTLAAVYFTTRVGLCAYKLGALGQAGALLGFVLITATSYASTGANASTEPLLVAWFTVMQLQQAITVGGLVVVFPLIIHSVETSILGSSSSSVQNRPGALPAAAVILVRLVSTFLHVCIVLTGVHLGRHLSDSVAWSMSSTLPCAVEAAENSTCATAPTPPQANALLFSVLHLSIFIVYFFTIWRVVLEALQLLNSKTMLFSFGWQPTVKDVHWRGPAAFANMRSKIADAFVNGGLLWWPVMRRMRPDHVPELNGIILEALIRVFNTINLTASVLESMQALLSNRVLTWVVALRADIADSNRKVNLHGISLRLTASDRRTLWGVLPLPRACWRRRPLMSIQVRNGKVRSPRKDASGMQSTNLASIPIALSVRVYTAAVCRQMRRLELYLRAPSSLQPSTAWRTFLMHKEVTPWLQHMRAPFAHSARGLIMINSNNQVIGRRDVHGHASIAAAQGEASLEDVPDDSSVAEEDAVRDVWEVDRTDSLYLEYLRVQQRQGGRESAVDDGAVAATAAQHVDITAGSGWLLPRVTELFRSVLGGEPIRLPGERYVRWWNLTLFNMGRVVVHAVRDDARQAARDLTNATGEIVEGTLGPLAEPLRGFIPPNLLQRVAITLRRFIAYLSYTPGRDSSFSASQGVVASITSWLQRGGSSAEPDASADVDDSLVELELVMRQGFAVLRVPLVAVSAAEGWHGLLLEEETLHHLVGEALCTIDALREQAASMALMNVAAGATGVGSDGVTDSDAHSLPPAIMRHYMRTVKLCAGTAMLPRNDAEVAEDMRAMYADATILYESVASATAAQNVQAQVDAYCAWAQATAAMMTRGSYFTRWERAVAELEVIFHAESRFNASRVCSGAAGTTDADAITPDEPTPQADTLADAAAPHTLSSLAGLQAIWRHVLNLPRAAADGATAWYRSHTMWRWCVADLVQRLAESYVEETAWSRQQRGAQVAPSRAANEYELDLDDAGLQDDGIEPTLPAPAPAQPPPPASAAGTSLRSGDHDLTGAELIVHVVNMLASLAAEPLSRWRRDS